MAFFEEDDESEPLSKEAKKKKAQQWTIAVRLLKEIREFVQSDRIELCGNAHRWFNEVGRTKYKSVARVRILLSVLLGGEQPILDYLGGEVFLVRRTLPGWPAYQVPTQRRVSPTGFGSGPRESPEEKKARLEQARARNEKAQQDEAVALQERLAKLKSTRSLPVDRVLFKEEDW